MNAFPRNPLRRRGFLAQAAAIGALPLGSKLQAAQPWPSRALKWVVPYLAGTGPDTTARIVAEALGKILGQPVVIDNRGGAGGNLGARQVAKSAADGYTWIYSGSPMAASMRMYKAPGYDVLKDFRHVMGLTSADSVVIVHPDSNLHTLEQLLDRLRARPGQIDYASGGIGTPSHLGVEMMLSVARVQALHVPYKGASEIVNAVLGRQVGFAAPISTVAYAQLQAGRLRALATTGHLRNPKLAGVPTLAEAGVPGVELSAWGGVSVPAATPDALVARLAGALRTAMRQPQVVSALEEQGGQVLLQDGEAYTQAFGREMRFTETMMRKTGLEPL